MVRQNYQNLHLGQAAIYEESEICRLGKQNKKEHLLLEWNLK